MCNLRSKKQGLTAFFTFVQKMTAAVSENRGVAGLNSGYKAAYSLLYELSINDQF